MTMMMLREEQLLEKFRNLNLEISVNPRRIHLSALMIINELEDQIRNALPKDLYVEEAKGLIDQGRTSYLKFIDNGLLKFGDGLYVHVIESLRETILAEAH